MKESQKLYDEAIQVRKKLRELDKDWYYSDVSVSKVMWLPLVRCDEVPDWKLWERGIKIMKKFINEINWELHKNVF